MNRAVPATIGALLWALTGISARAQNEAGSPDPVFDTVPFDQWFEGGEQARLKWSSRVFSTGLTNHQRLGARTEVLLDGVEILKRRGPGEILVLVQFEDKAGRRYRGHRTLPLDDVKEEARHSMVQFLQDAFVRPGDYRVSIAIFAASTKEHAVAQRTLHIDPLPRDPLPDAWRDLPPVELITAEDAPDMWWIPQAVGRLNLPVQTSRPIRVELMVNESATEQATGGRFGRASGRTIAALLPAFKVLSQIRPARGFVDAALLDLARRRVVFEQRIEPGSALDWSSLSSALSDASPHLIDVKSLENRQQNAQFFVSEVARRMAPAGAGTACAVIVLTGPMTFDKGEVLSPIQVPDKPGCHLFYVRYSVFAPRVLNLNPSLSEPTRGRGSGGAVPPVPQVMNDSLERTVKPLDPRLFDVNTPAQFRKALASILAEVSRLGN